MGTARVSIALATYNGGKYLAEQLESYLSQTRLPDELIVGDDGSSDDTLAILEGFSRRAPFPVQVHCNAVALGPAYNFFHTARRCSGDIILFSDQDDIWRPGKIAALEAQFSADPHCWLVTHDAALVDADGRPLGLSMGRQIEAARGGLAERDLVAGCCMAFHRNLLKMLDPIPRTRQHDALLAHKTTLLGLRRHVPLELIDYRRHGGNVSSSFMSDSRQASTWRRFADRWQRARSEPVGKSLEWSLAAREDLLQAIEKNKAMLEEVVTPEAMAHTLSTLSRNLESDCARLAVHRAPLLMRPFYLAKALVSGAYLKSGGWLSLLRDISGLLTRWNPA